MGEPITMGPNGLAVPDEPIIPFIEGDGTGPDIWAASVRVFDAAVDKAYGGALESGLAGSARRGEGQRANGLVARRTRRSMPSVATWSGSRARLTTPVGGGIRSLNVALRQILDLYACVRPVRWFAGVPSPVKEPEPGRHDHFSGEHRGRVRRAGARRGDTGGGKALSQFLSNELDGRSDPTPASASSRSR